MTHIIYMEIFHKAINMRRKKEIEDMAERGCVCVCACVHTTFVHCYPEHTLTLTWYHKEKKVAFCYLPLSGPPGDMHHTH